MACGRRGTPPGGLPGGGARGSRRAQALDFVAGGRARIEKLAQRAFLVERLVADAAEVDDEQRGAGANGGVDAVPGDLDGLRSLLFVGGGEVERV